MKRAARFIPWLAAALASACSDEAAFVGSPEPPPAGEEEGTAQAPEAAAAAGGSAAAAAAAASEGEVTEGAPAPPAAAAPGLPSEPQAGTPVTPQVAFQAPRGPCSRADRVGSFSIEKQVDFGVVQGSVSEAVVPTAVPRLELEEGSCQLLGRRTLACFPACVGAETCGEGGACVPYPRQVSVGEVTITGLTRETRMLPLAPGNAYFAPGADNPPYAIGGEIVLAAEGDGAVSAFQLFGVGSEPLEEAPSWRLEAGRDLALEWPAPASGVETTVLVELNVDQHGSAPIALSCEFPDSGSAVVPAAVITRLIDSGVSGFPNGRLTRRTADHVEVGGGCVELVVGSPLAASVAVAGFTPCTASGDCPSGQSCNVALERCE